MSQKAIKKRTIETFKHALHIPVKPLPRDNQRQAKPLPAKSFPLNKFIALPDGLKVKSKTEEFNQARRTIPIKAVAISPSSSSYNKAHIYAVGPEGNDLTSTHNIGVSKDRDTNKVTTNTGTAPLSTSTPRSDRRSRERRGYHSESSSRSTRPVTPTGSITSIDSEGSTRKGLYKKRSQSTPPDVSRQGLPAEFSDVLFSKWSDNDLVPGLNRTTSYQTVHDGVTIESDNWSIANVTSLNGRIQTVYRTNTGHSLDSSHDNSFVSSTRSSSPLEFTDVCNLNVDTVTPNDSYREDLDGVDFARSASHSGENTGVLNSDWNSFNESSHGFIQGPHYATLPRNYKVVRSDMNIDLTGKIKMDKINSPQLSLHNKSFEVNGNSQTGVLIYRPGKAGEKVIVNDQHPGMPNGGYEFYTVGRKEGSLVKSKLKFNSMPTLFDSKAGKGDKQLIKLLKRQEKEEKKRKEKEERKRAKEEKKRIKLEKKIKIKTLPRNFAYAHTNGHVLSPIENVYRRPKLSLSAVPIDFEDGPARSSPLKMAPPPPPEPSMRTKSMYASAPDLLRLEQIYGATIRGVPKNLNQPIKYSEYAPRTVVLQRASEGYGFVLRGAKSQLKPNGELDFRPTAEFPALQYLDSIDPGSAADRAGLKPGDFILEINGENVVRASHDRVVHLIRGTGDTLAMKVVTVRAGSRTHDWFNQKEWSSTMPNRKKKAPQPPQRDPMTSLSISRSEGRSVSEELAIMEKLDQAILEKKTSGEQKKTASIRSKLAAKRVSSVDLENIGVNPKQETKTGPNGYLERSKSTPDLLDTNSKSQHIYAVPGVNMATTASVIVNDPNSTGVRPKGPPPQIPEGNSPRKQAPKPPTQEMRPKSEVININTSKSSPYASSKIAVKKEDIKSESPYESSFRPGVSAKLSEEPPASEQSKLKPNLHHDTNAGVSVKSNTTVIHTGDDLDKPSVSFAEDKVFDSAASFLKKHPNAKLLVTAEVHNKIKNRNSSVYEPEPDYDQEDSGEDINKEPSSPVRRRDNRQSVTVISIGDKEKENESNARKRYTIHSTIPTEGKQQTSNLFIPPRPEGPAPVPPTNKSSQLSARESPKDQSSRLSVLKSSAPKEEVRSVPVSAPPPLPETPPPDMDMDDIPPEPTVVPAAPAPPAPAPPPPPPPPPPSELNKLPSNVKADYIPPIPKDDITAAVLKRQQRIESEGIRVTPQKPKTFTEQKDNNQAAILAAVANRRKVLEQSGENAVIESIESRLQRTKKLQAAKFNFASPKTAVKKDSGKEDSKSSSANTKANPSSVEKSSVKKEQTVPKTNDKPVKEVTSAKPHEISFKVKPVTSPTTKSPTEIKPKFNVKSGPKPPIEAASKTEKLKVEVKKVETVQKPVSDKVETESKNVESKNETNMNGQSDFLALAEKKRQQLLQRKSQKSPTESKTSSARSSISSSPEKEQFRIKKNSPPTQPKPNSKFPVKGVTTDQSDTENRTTRSFVKIKPISDMNGDIFANEHSNSTIATVPPPPVGFRDGGNDNTVVQLEIIPPPATFSTDSGVDMSHQHSPAFSPDTASLVSSLSTLSSLSGDQNEFRSTSSGYEDMIAPPPPGFGDDDSTTVIPPPPEFGIEKEKPFVRKSVETWLCNDVLDWLDSIKMSQYKKSFQSNCIDGKKLIELTRNDYLKLEVTQVSHRMNIERSIKKAAIKQNVGASEIIASERL